MIELLSRQKIMSGFLIYKIDDYCHWQILSIDKYRDYGNGLFDGNIWNKVL